MQFSEEVQRSFDTNQRLWDERVSAHRSGTFYDVDRFLAGGDTLGPIERAELGDVRGLRIAHLQCHFGMDSISLARRGAQVVALDFSAEGIAEARRLAAQAGVAAEFVHGNVYDAREKLTGRFDIVFTSWGTVIWLPDMLAWAKVVASLLKPGGSFHFVDGHPALYCHEVDGSRLVVAEDWQTPIDRPIVLSGTGSYAAGGTQVMESHEWIHSVATMVNALAAAGLRIDWLREHDGLPWQQLPAMQRGPDGLFRLPPELKQLPCALSIKATLA